MKLNQKLAKTELTRSQYKALLAEYGTTFKDQKKSHIFTGVRMKYTPESGYMDEPSKSGFRPVMNTVHNYLKYFLDTCGEHISNIFDIEATNGNNTVTAKLVVDGK